MGIGAIILHDRAGGIVIDGSNNAELRGIAKFLSESTYQIAVVGLVVASLANPVIIENIRPLIVLFQNQIHHARNRIGTIGGAAAMVEDFDTINRSQGNRI